MSLQLRLFDRLDALAGAVRQSLDAARRQAANRATGVPRPIPVLVPSAQIGEWLQVSLARQFGLSLGCEFLSPKAFLERSVTADPAATALAAAHAFWSPDRLRWQLLPRVQAVKGELGLDGAELSPRDQFAFAQLLAGQFDRYLRHRPDWADAWGGGSTGWPVPPSAAAVADETWQRALWAELASLPDAPPHPAQVLAQLARAAPAVDTADPVFVVGIRLLDPLLLRGLQVLAARGHAVSLFLFLPSLGYLGDLSRRRPASARAAAEESESGQGHPLLASLAAQAIGTFHLLETASPQYDEWEPPEPEPALPEGTPLLRRLQSDIRAQRPPAGPPAAPEQPDPRPVLAAEDRSLRVHSCHSPRRELEVLRDELLRAFAEIPGLQPEDVRIGVTDFDRYAPLAESILRSGSARLPIRLTAIPAREANPIAVALVALLPLASGRLTASAVLELLKLTAIQQRLDLASAPEAASRLEAAIRHSGLTAGLDGASRPLGDDTGTLRFALDRHLAGAWVGPLPAVHDAGGTPLYPVAGDLPNEDAAILRLMAWLHRLGGHLADWATPAPAATWAERLTGAVDSLLYSESLDDHTVAVRRLCGELARVAAATPLDAGAILDWLQPQLENATSLRTSLGGEILLGRVEQVVGLPCRVLALLGLEDGTFPRTSRLPAWDLLAHRPERWDPEPRVQDRQLFLDAVLAPADRLILSAANRSLRTPHDGPLSSCVGELLRVAGDTVRGTEPGRPIEAQLVVRHRIQPFAAEYFTAGGALPRSFDPAAAEIAPDVAAGARPPPKPFFTPGTGDAPPAEEETVTLAQLVRFWRDPPRAWLRHLQIDVADDETDASELDEPPVSLSALQAAGVRQAALDAGLRADASATVTRGRMAADRALPPGVLARFAWERGEREVADLTHAVRERLPRTTPTPLAIEAFPGWRLTGDVLIGDRDQSPWLLFYRPSAVGAHVKYQLEAYIHALAATVFLQAPVACEVLDRNEQRRLEGWPVAAATRQLASLLDGYRRGRAGPLCFAPETSAACAARLASGAAPEDALSVALDTWNREPFAASPAGEGLAPAARLAWREGNPFVAPHAAEWLAWTQAVAQPLQAWWKGLPQPAAASPALASHP